MLRLLVSVLLLFGSIAFREVSSGVIPNTFQHVERLKHLSPEELAEELSGQFEGDIVLSDGQERELRKRTGVRLSQATWPNGIVPYEIVQEDFDPAQLIAIDDALKDIERISCIRFVPKISTTLDFVRITGSSSGCFSFVGRRGGAQQLNLQPANPGSGCFRHGTMLHELIHALGFYHMHSATDRDQYVTIRWENVEQGAEINFQTYGTEHITDFGMEYDYASIMHYSATAFSANGGQTISTNVPVSIGQRFWMSEGDIWRIWKMYQCS